MRLTRRKALGLAGAAGAAALAVGCGSGPSGNNAPSSSTPSSSATTATPAQSAEEQSFISDIRTTYSFRSSVSDSEIASFGREVCSKREAGGSQADAAQVATSTWTNTTSTEGEAMARLAEKKLCPAQLPVETWHVVANYSGSGNWNSGQFTLRDSPVEVTYSYSNNTSGAGGDNFIADITSSTDDLSIANDIAVSGGKTITLYPDLSLGGSPQFHLEVLATGSWSFTIKQKY